MKNRNASSPILHLIVFSLVAHSPLLAEADSGAQAPASLPSAAGAGPSGKSVAKQSSTYRVVAGDSLTSIAQKFNTTRKALRKLNDLTSSTVRPGQVLQVPRLGGARTATAALNQNKTHHPYLVAQPVQDFDIPASTFGSCPVPMPDEDAETPAPADKPAPIAKLVSPAELAKDLAGVAPPNSAPSTGDAAPAPGVSPRHPATAVPGYSGAMAASSSLTGAPVDRPAARSLAQMLGFGAPTPAPADDWGGRFLQEARALGDEGIEYDEDWRPPGESRAWTMDCSNTTRYLYKVTTGIQLPRTASDQYYYLHLQGKAWEVPEASDGWADGNFLRRNLKPGDLLFWENTYRPERQPPITHVMVFLGTNDRGQWIMAGSQTSRGGEHNRRNGGPDIYVFRPSQPCGGYTTWLGLVHHQGRFCAFGRPLEADPAKLAMAGND
jgi:cell wall-associated NlpC family hydrolase